MRTIILSVVCALMFHVTPALSENAFHYKLDSIVNLEGADSYKLQFTYDDSCRINTKSVYELRNGGWAMRNKYRYEYDDLGRLLRVSSYYPTLNSDGRDSLALVGKYSYVYEGNRLQSVLYVPYDTVGLHEYIRTFTYDDGALGVVSKRELVDGDWILTSQDIHEHDGDRSVRRTVNMSRDSVWESRRTEQKLDSAGRVSVQREFLFGKQISQHTYTYNESGSILKDELLEGGDGMVSKEVNDYYYDKRGNLLSIVTHADCENESASDEGFWESTMFFMDLNVRRDDVMGMQDRFHNLYKMVNLPDGILQSEHVFISRHHDVNSVPITQNCLRFYISQIVR